MNAVITGATKGIGFAIAEILALNGYNLCINSRSEEDLKASKAKLMEINNGISVFCMATDMSDKSQVVAFGDFALQSMTSIDILINNAGIFIPGATIEEDEGHLEKQMETNLYSAYHLTRKLISKMIDKKSGHVFNMCSIASKIAYPNGGSYSISKFALYGYTKVLREELKEKGIKVTAILPGATWSNSWAGVDLPKERLMEAEDIAKSVLSAIQLSPSAVVEDIILRPQLGDL